MNFKIKTIITLLLIVTCSLSAFAAQESNQVNAKDSQEITAFDDRIINPTGAAFLSLAPVYSGSFLRGFDRGGLVFSIFKTFHFATAASFLITFALPTDLEGDDAEGLVYLFFAGVSHLTAWFTITIIDMIYSYKRIKSQNNTIRERKKASLNKSAYNTVSYVVVPRVYSHKDPFTGKVSSGVDGANIAATLRF